MRRWGYTMRTKIKFWAVMLVVLTAMAQTAFANIYVNILAVNGTDEAKEQDIKQFLPKELTAEDIIDTAGLELDYDVNEGAYFVKGKVTLGAKETKTYKILIRDLWQLEQAEVEEIRKQIDVSVSRLEGTEYHETGQQRQKNLTQRLDFITTQLGDNAENITQRIDRYRAYADEIKDIRDNAVSVKYWRSKPPDPKENQVFTLVIEVENPSDKEEKVVRPQHYLPAEVKPENIDDLKGFDYKYDIEKGQPYLEKEETLAPAEKKKYTISLIDVWSIPQKNIDNLKDRTRRAYEFLQETQYEQNASFLVANIKKQLEKVELSQAQEKNIKEHISAFRSNTKSYDTALNDVKSLEALLEVARENLEKSKIKNVLQKVKSLRSIADISEAIFGTKPSVNNAWKIITAIVIFVGVFTMLHFAIWGKRSRQAKIEEAKNETETEKKPEEKKA